MVRHPSLRRTSTRFNPKNFWHVVGETYAALASKLLREIYLYEIPNRSQDICHCSADLIGGATPWYHAVLGLFVNLSLFHHERDAAERLNIVQRIALHSDDVGKHAGFEVTCFFR